MDKLKIKYVASVVIDIIIVDLLVFFFLIEPVIVLAPLIQRLLPFTFLLCFLVQDKILFGNSIGKRILGIKLISGDNNSTTVSIQQVVIRRILEMIYVTKIFMWRLVIDIPKITNTRIVSKSEIFTESVKLTSNYSIKVSKSLVKYRVYAMLIDFAIISWALILYYLVGIPTIRNSISNDLFIFVRFVLNIIIILYFLFKDFIYKNRSIGKFKQNIEILDQENHIPSKVQIVLRNIIVLVFFPIEFILLLSNYKLICDRITYTQISFVTLKNHRIKQ